jgi:hypothetical protein
MRITTTTDEFTLTTNEAGLEVVSVGDHTILLAGHSPVAEGVELELYTFSGAEEVIIAVGVVTKVA